jgi:hypothetical protein
MLGERDDNARPRDVHGNRRRNGNSSIFKIEKHTHGLVPRHTHNYYATTVIPQIQQDCVWHVIHYTRY